MEPKNRNKLANLHKQNCEFCNLTKSINEFRKYKSGNYSKKCKSCRISQDNTKNKIDTISQELNFFVEKFAQLNSELDELKLVYKKFAPIEVSEDDFKVCKYCKNDKEKSEFYSRNTCKKCNSKIKSVIRRKKKVKYIDLKGGKCCKCDYNNNYSCLDFHHRNPSEKEYTWNDMINLSEEQILEELEKCDVLCKNCHAELHNPSYNKDDIESDFCIESSFENEIDIETLDEEEIVKNKKTFYVWLKNIIKRFFNKKEIL